MLSEKQVDYILNDIRRNGIETEELQLNLLDHICCVIENEMSPEKTFDELYRSVLSRFFKKELKEIQEETDLLLTFKNYYAMKKVMLRSGMFSAVAFTIGAIFKIMHWPGAAMMLVLAITSVSFVFLPIFFLVKRKEVKQKKEKFILGFGAFFGILFCISTLFKIMHWPGANLLWLVGLGVLFFLFLPLFFFTGIRNPETKLNTILSSIMILVAGGLLFTMTSLRSSQDAERSTAFGNEHLAKISSSGAIVLKEKYSKISDSLVIKMTEWKLLSQSVCDKIDKVKNDLSSYLADGDPVKIKLLQQNKVHVNSYLIRQFLFDDKGNAKLHLQELRSSIEAFKASAVEHYKVDFHSFLDLSNHKDERGEIITWEEATFENAPLATIWRNLNQLLLETRFIESVGI